MKELTKEQALKQGLEIFNSETLTVSELVEHLALGIAVFVSMCETARRAKLYDMAFEYLLAAESMLSFINGTLKRATVPDQTVKDLNASIGEQLRGKPKAKA